MTNQTGDTIRRLGAFGLVAALVLSWFAPAMPWLCWLAIGVLAGVGALDIVLLMDREDTISDWIHRLLPWQGDYAVLALLVGFTWCVFGEQAFLPACIWVIAGHLFWQE